MEAALLIFDVIGITLVLLWAARDRGEAGLFAWRDDNAAKPEPSATQKAPRRR